MVNPFDELLGELAPMRMVLSTLEDFGVVVTGNSGAILYSRSHDLNDLSRNIHASAVASGLGIGLDYAKKTYTSARDGRDERSARSRYVAAYRAARFHTEEAQRRLSTNPDAPLSLGTYASSVAMERLSSGFTAAHILYMLGLNLEGDAVARQILEQLSWSLVAADLDTHESIGKVRAEKQVGALRELVPAMGRMYGWLSRSTHAGIDQHQESFQIDANERGVIILAQSRLAESAANLLLLSDAWVVVWEVTQRQHLSEVASIESVDDPTPRVSRPFLLEARDLVASINEAEEASRTG